MPIFGGVTLVILLYVFFGLVITWFRSIIDWIVKSW